MNDEERCICCGEPIPEGRKVCMACKLKAEIMKKKKARKKAEDAIIIGGLLGCAALCLWALCVSASAMRSLGGLPKPAKMAQELPMEPMEPAEPPVVTQEPEPLTEDLDVEIEETAAVYECGEGVLDCKAFPAAEPCTYPQEWVRITGANGCTAWAWELNELTAIVWLEVRGESQHCQRLVTQTILNRQSYGHWGDTIHEVLSAVEDDGSLAFTTWPHLLEAKPDAEFQQRVWDVFRNGETLASRVMWFHAGSYHDWDGAVDEFCVDNTYFSSSVWVEVEE